MRGHTALALAAAAALALSACGDGGDDPQGKSGSQRQAAAQPERSTLGCLDLSVLSPERDTEANNEPGPEIRALLTGGARSSTILGGDELGATVIEYPTVDAARRAHGRARASKELKQAGAQGISVRRDVLFIDHSEDSHIQKIVRACTDRPDEPPPSP
jgi:hypothetical protein